MKITLDGTPKEIAQMLQVLQVKQPQITPGAIAAEKIEDSIAKDVIPYEAIRSRSNVTSAKIAGHSISANDPKYTFNAEMTEEEQQ